MLVPNMFYLLANIYFCYKHDFRHSFLLAVGLSGWAISPHYATKGSVHETQISQSMKKEVKSDVHTDYTNPSTASLCLTLEKVPMMSYSD